MSILRVSQFSSSAAVSSTFSCFLHFSCLTLRVRTSSSFSCMSCKCSIFVCLSVFRFPVPLYFDKFIFWRSRTLWSGSFQRCSTCLWSFGGGVEYIEEWVAVVTRRGVCLRFVIDFREAQCPLAILCPGSRFACLSFGILYALNYLQSYRTIYLLCFCFCFPLLCCRCASSVRPLPLATSPHYIASVRRKADAALCQPVFSVVDVCAANRG